MVHWRPHTDELYALILLLLLGEAILPGISTAKVAYTRNAQSITGKGWEKDWDNGILYVGCVGGPLDEHARLGNARKEGCSALLVATLLGIENNPQFVPVLQLINQADNEQVKEKYHLSSLLKVGYSINNHPKAMEGVIDRIRPFLHRAQRAAYEGMTKYNKATEMLHNPALAAFWAKAATLPSYNLLMDVIKKADTENQSNLALGAMIRVAYTLHPNQNVIGVLETVIWFLDNEIERQKNFEDAKTVIEEIKQTRTWNYKKLTDKNGNLFTVLVIQSDNLQMAPAALHSGIDVVIVVKSTGHCAMLTSNGRHNVIDMAAVVKAIRTEEYLAHGGALADLVGIDLTVEGAIKEAIMWHYQSGTAQNMFCGSDTVPDQIKSKLSLGEILEIVCQHILKK